MVQKVKSCAERSGLACRLMERAVHLVAEGRAEFMVASHNQESIEKAAELMHELGLLPSDSPVYFGQLLGMADPLTYVLGANGYKVNFIPQEGASGSRIMKDLICSCTILPPGHACKSPLGSALLWHSVRVVSSDRLFDHV